MELNASDLGNKTMKAIVVSKFGSESNLKFETNYPLPQMGGNQVLVKVHAAGINPVDTYIREGNFVALPSLPYVPGKDGAGTITSVGSSITKFEPGQRVYFCLMSNSTQDGSYAEYVAVDERNVFPLPLAFSFEQGAAIGIPYFTAYRALFQKCNLKQDETVLIHGASGAVGLAAVQIAHVNQAKVIGTASTKEGLALVQSQGAAEVYNHSDSKYLEKIKSSLKGKGIDVIIEMLSNVNLQHDLELLSPNGRVSIVGCRGSISIDPRSMMFPETHIIGVALAAATSEEWSQIADNINNNISQGTYHPIIHKVYPLGDASKAHHDIIHVKGARGNLILSI